MQELIQRVLEKDTDAITLAKQVGAGANPELRKLAKHADAEVREIALYCLDATGGPGAVETFVESLLDNNAQVRAAGLEGLEHHPDPTVYPALLQTYDKSRDSSVRQQIALIIGRMSRGVDVKDLRKRLEVEKDAEAREGCIVALARLNDPEAQADFIKRLHESNLRDRPRYLECCEYIHAPWLLKPLLPLLGDKENMVYVGLDGVSDITEYLRACDVAVNLIASISGHKFSFAVNGLTNYNDVQLDEVRRYVELLR